MLSHIIDGKILRTSPIPFIIAEIQDTQLEVWKLRNSSTSRTRKTKPYEQKECTVPPTIQNKGRITQMYRTNPRGKTSCSEIKEKRLKIKTATNVVTTPLLGERKNSVSKSRITVMVSSISL